MVIAHTGAQPDSAHEDHEVCESCKQEKAIMLMLGGDEMEKLFDHVGKVQEEDTFQKALNKVQNGIKGLTNQATARYKLFQEMPQDGQVFSTWAQLVVEQADRCDWQNYDKDKAARDAILYQLDDVKLKKKILAENLSYEQTVKWGMTHESSSKKAKQVEETTNTEQKIRRLEEKVSRLQTDEKKGLISCKTCTRKHPQGVLCPDLGGTCYACGEDGHFRGATICKGEKVKDRKKGEKKGRTE